MRGALPLLEAHMSTRRSTARGALPGGLALLVALLVATPPQPALAEVVRLINHEGLLLDAQNEPMEGAFQLTFRLYDAPAGQVGDALWEETHDVQVSSGYYQLLLGSQAPGLYELAIKAQLFNAPDSVSRKINFELK